MGPDWDKAGTSPQHIAPEIWTALRNQARRVKNMTRLLAEDSVWLRSVPRYGETPNWSTSVRVVQETAEKLAKTSWALAPEREMELLMEAHVTAKEDARRRLEAEMVFLDELLEETGELETT